MFVRIYSGQDGWSHFEELGMAEGSAFFSKAQSAKDIEFKNDRPDFVRDWHNPKKRRYVITLGGSVDISTGDGTVKTFGPGDVLLAEDLTGQGHKTVQHGDWIRAFISL